LEAVQAIVLLLAPFAPHICEELWLKLGQTSSVHLADWPSYDS
jgi:leucyl-tRNA synthetase